MKGMKRLLQRIFSGLIAIALAICIIPQTSLAANPNRSTGHYKVEIQAVIRDSEGNWVSTNALPSKKFNGTTLAGSSGGYDGEWQWVPDGNGYILIADLNSHANAWGRLKAPSELWEYDSDELELVGIGKNSYATEVSYNVPEYDWQWDSRYNEFSYNLAASAGYTDYRTYLDFDLIVTNKEGVKSRLSNMIKKKSGGETQTPFYIAVLASFAQIYHTKDKGEAGNAIRLIIFDEAFSKMDRERSRESIKLLRKFNLQAIVSAPSEKVDDISDLVDETLTVLHSKRSSCVRLFARDDKQD